MTNPEFCGACADVIHALEADRDDERRRIVEALRGQMPPMGRYTEEGWLRAADFIERMGQL